MEWNSGNVKQVGSLDAVRRGKILLIFDLDDTLSYSDNNLYENGEYPAGSDYGLPIPSAVEFVQDVLARDIKVECFILTANGNVEDIMAKVRDFATAVGRNSLFKYILYRSKPGYYKKTYEKILELYYGDGPLVHIPYPIYFFDNAKDQINSVYKSAMDARAKCLFTVHVERADLASTWATAKGLLLDGTNTLPPLSPIVLTPRPTEVGGRRTRRRKQKK